MHGRQDDGAAWDDLRAAAPPVGGLPADDFAPDEMRPQGALGWHVLLGLDLAFLGLNVIFAVVLVVGSLMGAAFADEALDGIEFTKAGLWLETALNFTMFGIIPFLWVVGTRVGGLGGALRYLRLERPWPDAAIGAALAPAFVLVFGGLALLLDQFGLVEENETIVGILDVIDWPLAIGISLAAGIGEEILFRGVLQRWIGMWGQAAVFGSLHIAQGLLGVAVTFTIALVFGFIVRRGGSLWMVIVAHFLYDLIILGVGILYPEAAGGEAEEAVLRWLGRLWPSG